MKKYIALFLHLAIGLSAQAQKPYLVYLKDKAQTLYSTKEPLKFISERAIARREKFNIALVEQDLPLSDSYLSEITKTGAAIWGKSKWLNAVLLVANTEQLDKIKAFSFVKSIENNAPINGTKITESLESQNKLDTQIEYNYGSSLNQIQQLEADQMHKDNFTGKGVLIAIFDGGFPNVDKIDALKAVFETKRVLDTWDFVSKDKTVTEATEDQHGTLVMSCIGANQTGRLIGTAPDASFALYKTEDVLSETRIEEVYWLLAAERADSLGADIINSSLGYTTFDNRLQNYTYSNMDGRTAMASRAANIAVSKGICVVVSAGNDGGNNWRFVGTPADADSALTVGAVDQNGNPSNFTSYGPNAREIQKPEVAARGTSTTVATSNNTIGNANGTSFSSPLIAGYVAGFLQAFPKLPPYKIKEILSKSATLYPGSSSRVGFGIPKYKKAKELLNEYVKSIVLANEPSVDFSSLEVFPNPVSKNTRLILSGKELETSDKLSLINTASGQKIAAFLYSDLSKTLEQLPTGTYIINTQNDQKEFRTKLIKP
jgi:serine protease AprX